jgi:phytoene synthase
VVELREAYAACERLARSHAENFPVASLLLPRSRRHHVAAVYAFARTADDFADEGNADACVRLRQLESWRVRLHAAAGGVPPASGEDGDLAETAAIFVALGHTIRELRLPLNLFDDLLDAFRQDVTVRRYRSWEELFDYCRRSANPIGRLVLRICSIGSDRLDGYADAFCTALQLTNFWQDLGIDVQRGRVYLPLEELERAGAGVEDLAHPSLSGEARQAVAAAVSRTRRLFEMARPLCREVGGRFAFELRLTWLGGVRVLDLLERQGFDPVARRPRLGAADALPLAWKLVTWR